MFLTKAFATVASKSRALYMPCKTTLDMYRTDSFVDDTCCYSHNNSLNISYIELSFSYRTHNTQCCTCRMSVFLLDKLAHSRHPWIQALGGGNPFSTLVHLLQNCALQASHVPCRRQAKQRKHSLVQSIGIAPHSWHVSFPHFSQ